MGASDSYGFGRIGWRLRAVQGPGQPVALGDAALAAQIDPAAPFYLSTGEAAPNDH